MKMVPISSENIDFIRLDLSRHYIQIDCDFVCYIVLNPSGTIPVGGTDVCAFHVGAWQVDSWKFLTKDFAQIPGFSACLVWDRTLVTELSKAPQVAESDIDTANSISSLKGQPVNITGFSLAEGESLKVSTLESEYVNTLPFPMGSYGYNTNNPRYMEGHYLYNISVGDVIPDWFSNYKKGDEGSTEVFNFNHCCFYSSNASSNIQHLVMNFENGSVIAGWDNTDSSGYHCISGTGVCSMIDFLIESSDGIITSIHTKLYAILNCKITNDLQYTSTSYSVVLYDTYLVDNFYLYF